MAIVWQHSANGRTYEVRNAGASLRLYTNGAFHSQYNPHHLVTGAVWDLLTLPALFQPGSADNVLLLGVGGGTAIHQLNRLVSPAAITGIELDPVHLRIARQHFNVDAPNVELIEADALKWVKQARCRFDLVIDDLFLDAPDDPERPAPVDAGWLARLAGLTGPGGILVQNHLSTTAVRALLRQHNKQLRRWFSTALLFTTPKYENGIVAFYRQPVRLTEGRELALRHIGQLSRTALRQLRFDCETLFRP